MKHFGSTGRDIGVVSLSKMNISGAAKKMFIELYLVP